MSDDLFKRSEEVRDVGDCPHDILPLTSQPMGKCHISCMGISFCHNTQGLKLLFPLANFG